MLKASDLRHMPANHEFARGIIELPDLSPNPLIWVGKWSGRDWCLKVAPSHHTFKEVSERGKIVDVEKYIKTIQPCDSEAFNLYQK